MKLLSAWIVLILIFCAIVLPGRIEWLKFDHFWQKWEFLAATTAAAYNLFFTIVIYAYGTQADSTTLHKVLQTPLSVAVYLILRVSLPSLLLAGAAVVIWSDRAHGHQQPVDPKGVVLKLVLTFLAFAAICVGDLLTSRHLQHKKHPHEADLEWARHLKRHAWLIDLPLVLAYLGLVVIFIGHQNTREDMLLLQAFIGGASALEMLILSAVHGFAEFADREERSQMAIEFRSPTRAS